MRRKLHLLRDDNDDEVLLYFRPRQDGCLVWNEWLTTQKKRYTYIFFFGIYCLLLSSLDRRGRERGI